MTHSANGGVAASRSAAVAARMMQSASSREICLPGVRCGKERKRDRSVAGVHPCALPILAAAQINGSCPFAHTKDRLLAETRDRLILKSQLTPGLGASLHCRTLVNIIVYYSRTR